MVETQTQNLTLTRIRQPLSMVVAPTVISSQQLNVLPMTVVGTNQSLFVDLKHNSEVKILPMHVAEQDQLHIQHDNKELALHLKQEFRGKYGNSINYVARYIEHLNASPEELKYTVIGAIEKAVIEHPLAEAGKVFKYPLQWQNGKLKFGAHFMDDTYAEGEENKAGQIPLFEIHRNQINRQNYDKIKTLHSEGYRGKMVEFSPSPNMSTSQKAVEALRRGYKGYDTIFIYDFSDPNQLKVEQTWLNKSDINEWRNLLWEVALDGTNDLLLEQISRSAVTPEDIMAASKDFNESQLNRIRKFIETKKVNKLGKQNEIGEAENKVSQSIDLEIYPLVKNLGQKIALGNITTDQIDIELKNIFELMTVEQYKLYKIIKGEDVSQIMQLDHGGIMGVIRSEGFEFMACGIGNSLRAPIFGKSSGGANINMEMFKASIGYDPTKHYICEGCGHVYDIDVYNGVYRTEKCTQQTSTGKPCDHVPERC